MSRKQEIRVVDISVIQICADRGIEDRCKGNADDIAHRTGRRTEIKASEKCKR